MLLNFKLMKKIASILLASLLLLSGVNFSVANHICGGKLVAVKLSFDHEKASCGMKSDYQASSSDLSFKKDCCHDNIQTLLVDKQYKPSKAEFHKVFFSVISLLFLPVEFVLNQYKLSSDLTAENAPPNVALRQNVSLSQLCVFII